VFLILFNLYISSFTNKWQHQNEETRINKTKAEESIMNNIHVRP